MDTKISKAGTIKDLQVGDLVIVYNGQEVIAISYIWQSFHLIGNFFKIATGDEFDSSTGNHRNFNNKSWIEIATHQKIVAARKAIKAKEDKELKAENERRKREQEEMHKKCENAKIWFETLTKEQKEFVFILSPQCSCS